MGEKTMTTLTVTGITYLDGCMPLTGIAINSDGDEVNLIFNEQRVALLDTIEATGEMVTSPHHGGRPAFAIASVQDCPAAIKCSQHQERWFERARHQPCRKAAAVVSLSRSDRNTQGDAARNRK
jgi:hypothetical protein